MKIKLSLELLNHPSFENWLIYLEQFMTRKGLYHTTGKAVVATSGGRDSIFLLLSLYGLYKRGKLTSLSVLHFNHGTRKECESEENFVRLLAKKLDLSCTVIPLQLTFGPNFENRAHTLRLDYYKSYRDSAMVYLGHHIDDSFEWAFMNMMKVSTLKPSLGMPLRHGNLARPLFCLTRGQINHFCARYNIPYRDDPSNRSMQFERNQIRLTLKHLENSYPSLLKNYVVRSNELAKKMGLSLDHTAPLYKKIDKYGGISLYTSTENFHHAYETIREIIVTLSTNQRGELRREIRKLILAAREGKSGPMSFSGGVKCYLHRNYLYFFSSKSEKKIIEDKNTLYGSLTMDQARSSLIQEIIQKTDYPHFIIIHERQSNFSVNRPHPLFPSLSQALLESGKTFLTISDYVRKEDKLPPRDKLELVVSH